MSEDSEVDHTRCSFQLALRLENICQIFAGVLGRQLAGMHMPCYASDLGQQTW